MLVGKPERKTLLVEGRIILECFLKKQGMRM
jgi:hypothetical protein